MLAPVVALGLMSCSREHPVADMPTTVPPHEHAPKHGGALAELGKEEFHLEFTLGDTPGVLQAYVMDGEVEEYIRIQAPSFAATATVGNETFPLTFHAVASSESGETVGDTALFEARADWLTRRPAMKVTVPTITVKGHTYTGVTAELAGREKP
jgi:hypothetical protein